MGCASVFHAVVEPAGGVAELRSLMEERDFITGVPAQERILTEDTGANFISKP